MVVLVASKQQNMIGTVETWLSFFKCLPLDGQFKLRKRNTWSKSISMEHSNVSLRISKNHVRWFCISPIRIILSSFVFVINYLLKMHINFLQTGL
jgi:hypothetical protein